MKNVSFKRAAYDSDGYLEGYYSSIVSDNNIDGRIYFAADGIYLGNSSGVAADADYIGVSYLGLMGILGSNDHNKNISNVWLENASAETQPAGTNNSSVATTQFVATAIAASSTQAMILAGSINPANISNPFTNLNTALFPNAPTIQSQCGSLENLTAFTPIKAGWVFKIISDGIIYYYDTQYGAHHGKQVQKGDTLYITNNKPKYEGTPSANDYVTENDFSILSYDVDVFIGATDETAGSIGLVPAPEAGDQDKFLKGDGTWGEAGQVDGAKINGTDLTVTNKKIIIPIANSNPGGYGVISETLASGMQFIKTDYDEMTDEGHASLKILSDNVFDIEETVETMSDKLDTIESGSQANVQSDWNQTDTSADDYIKNKPTIPSGITVDSALDLSSTNPVQNKVITSTIDDIEDAVADLILGKVDQETDKSLMSNEEHAKLGGIPEDAASIGEFLAQPVRTDQTVVVYLEYTDKYGNHEPEAIIPSATSTDPGVMSAADKTKLNNIVPMTPDEEDLTLIIGQNPVLKFKDRAYSPSNNSGFGYKILRQDVLLANQITEANTKYEVRYDFNLGGTTLNIPSGCILDFNGGTITNGTLTGDNTTISGSINTKIFDLSINLTGTWNTQGINPEWFGAIADGVHDCYTEVQKAVDTAYSIKQDVVFLSGTYLFTRHVAIYDGISIHGAGIYNTILKTPWNNNNVAKGYVNNTASKTYKTRLHPESVPFQFDDYTNGHNRFYIGDGCVGYYDDDRATDSSHPLYWPDDGTQEWRDWNATRTKIRNQGRWIGKTGREGYGGGLFISSQEPGITFERYQVSSGMNLHPEGIIHTGVRNVKISDLQITTNSVDRGKDSAINFRYNADIIPKSIRSTYDSSVLNIQLENLYLFGCGKTGYEATRAVDHLIKGCYIRQCAEYGIHLAGVTSTTITGCYANGCLIAGYNLNGVNYSSLVGCAADSCGVAYNLRNCNGITLVSCGAESTKYTKPEEEDTEVLVKGVAYRINECSSIVLSGCYSFSSQLKQDLESVIESDILPDEDNWDYIKSRHVQVIESKDVSIQYPSFKSYCRIRTAPFRNADGRKVNVDGGTYDEFNPNSRYWQIQNNLTGAQFEVRGETTTAHVISSRGEQDLVKTSEVRINNLDIYDPGIYPNPYNSVLGSQYSANTAHKMISGSDMNGGWTVTAPNEDDDPVTINVSMDIFESIFPINAKSLTGVRDTFWKWRNSLILLRKRTDDKYLDPPSPGVTGWIDEWLDITGQTEIETPIDWTDSQYQSVFTVSTLPLIGSESTFIDGDKSLFSYGKLYVIDPEYRYSKAPTFCTPIPGIVIEKEDGTRTLINTNNVNNLPLDARKASMGIRGNSVITSEDGDGNPVVTHPGPVLATVSQYKADTADSDTVHMKCTSEQGYNVMTLFERVGKALSFGNSPRIISRDSNDYTAITKLTALADSSAIINKVNELIDRLVAQGFAEEEIPSEIQFRFLQLSDTTETGTNILFTVDNIPAYTRIGIAYSSSSTSPTFNSNHIEATLGEGSFSLNTPITYGNSNLRYVRFFLDPTFGGGGETDRIYSETYKLTYSEGVADFSLL